MSVKRYDITFNGCPEESSEMEERDDGEYVKAEDYDTLIEAARDFFTSVGRDEDAAGCCATKAGNRLEKIIREV